MYRAFGEGPGAFPDARITIHELIGVRGRVAARAEINGTHKGEFGVPETDKQVVIAIHEIHQVDNGRLTHTWHLEDWFGWMNQVQSHTTTARETER